MTAGEFSADEWIDRLARALPGLAEAQEPYLQEYYKQNRGVDVVYGGRDGDPPDFPLDDLRDLYAMALHGDAFGEQEYYASLCAVLDPVRSILRSHPTLERVVSRIIGWDEFWMEILSSGSLTSLTDLIAGLMARAAELSGDRFRAAAGFPGPVRCRQLLIFRHPIGGDMLVGGRNRMEWEGKVSTMELTLKGIHFSVLDLSGPVEDEFGWVDVDVVFHDKTTGGFPSMRLGVPVRYPLDWTVEQVREEAIRLSRELIEAAGGLEVPRGE